MQSNACFMIRFAFVLLFVVVTHSAFATSQRTDPLVWKGVTVYPQSGPTIWGAFPENKDIIQKPKFDIDSTGNYKGYAAKWEIKDDTLFITWLEGKIDGKKLGLSDVFPGKESPLAAIWYSGTVIIPRGKKIGLAKEGEARHIYTKETHLIIEKGKVVRTEEKTFDPEKTPVWKIN
jgi:hypothetical protein